MGTQVVALPRDIKHIDCGDLFNNASMLMRIRGNYMMPDYLPGAIVAAKEVVNKELVVYGKDYVVFTTEYKTLRRLQKKRHEKMSFNMFVQFIRMETRFFKS